MEIIRTPDSQFENLKDYQFEGNYQEINDQEGGTLRVHYLDEGPADADPGFPGVPAGNFTAKFLQIYGLIFR